MLASSSSSPWGIHPMVFLLLYPVALLAGFWASVLLRDTFHWRRAGARLVRDQFGQPDPELIGFVRDGRRGSLAAAFASLQARGALVGLGAGRRQPSTAGATALQEAVLAESTAAELAGPFPGSRVSAALRDIEARTLKAGLIRSERSFQQVRIVRLALPLAVVVVGFVRVATTTTGKPTGPVIALILLCVLTVPALILVPSLCPVRRTTGRGDALISRLSVLRDQADGPSWARPGAPGLAMAAALDGFDALYRFDPDFSLRLPDVPPVISRTARPGSYNSTVSSGGGCSGGGCGGGGCGG